MIKPDFSADRLLPSFLKIFPYLLISIVVTGYMIAFAINKFDTALKGLYLTVPIVIASVIILRKPNLNLNYIKFDLTPSNNHNIFISFMIYTLFYLLTILVLLIYNERTIIYFILITVIFCIILIQIFSFTLNNKLLEYIILTEIFLLFLNLVWGVTLKYPLYFGFTDILPHIAMVNSIIQSGHVTDYMDLYQFFPLYHILATMGIFISNMQMKTGFFTFLGLAYMTTLMFAYLFFQTVTKNTKISLLCLLIFSASKEFLFHGMYMVTRSMAFIFFIIILYLLIRKKYLEFELKLILLILTLSVILIHQVTVAYISIILIVMFIVKRYIYGKVDKKLYRIYVSLFIVSSLAYWIYVAFGFVTTSLRAYHISETTPAFTVITTVQESVFSFIQNHIVDMMNVFFIIIGFSALLNIKKVDKNLVFISFLSVLFFPFYITNLNYMFPQVMERFLFYRIPLMISIFVIIPIVYGALIFYDFLNTNIKTKNISLFGIIILLLLYLFFSIASPGLISDSNDFPSNNNENTPYFTVNELTAFSYVTDKMSEPIIYSDYQASRYFYNYKSYITTPQDIEEIYIYNYTSSTPPDIRNNQSGYFILRYKELQSRFLTLGITKFTSGGKYDNKLNSTNEPIQTILDSIYTKNKIYDSSDVGIYSFKVS